MNTNIVIAVIGVAIFLAVMVLVLGYLKVQPFDLAWAKVAPFISNFNVPNMLSNPASLLPMGITAIGVALPLLKWGGDLKNKLFAAKSQVTSTTNQLSDATTKISSYESKLADQAKTYEAKLSGVNTQIQDAVTKATSDADAKAIQLQNLNTNLNQKNQDLQAAYNKLQIQYNTIKEIKAVP